MDHAPETYSGSPEFPSIIAPAALSWMEAEQFAGDDSGQSIISDFESAAIQSNFEEIVLVATGTLTWGGSN